MWWVTKKERIEFLESFREFQNQTNRELYDSINKLEREITDLHLKLKIVQNLKLTNLKKGKKK